MVNREDIRPFTNDKHGNVIAYTACADKKGAGTILNG